MARKKKPRPKTSPVWSVSSEEFQKIISNCKTIGEVLSKFGLRNHGSNYKTLRRRLEEEKIDHTKFSKNYGHGRLGPVIPLDQILVENSSFSRTHLKARLLKTGMLSNKCYQCGQNSIWQNQRLVMVLDHINGINDDNRLENLRLLCPNCNSQSSTFAGRNNKKIGV